MELNEKRKIVTAILEMNEMVWTDDQNFTNELMNLEEVNLAYLFMKNLNFLKDQKRKNVRKKYISNDLFQYIISLLNSSKKNQSQLETNEILKELMQWRQKDFLVSEKSDAPLFNLTKLLLLPAQELDDILALCLYYQLHQDQDKNQGLVLQKIKKYFPYLSDFRQSLIRIQGKEIENWNKKTSEEKKNIMLACIKDNLSASYLSKTRRL